MKNLTLIGAALVVASVFCPSSPIFFSFFFGSCVIKMIKILNPEIQPL